MKPRATQKRLRICWDGPFKGSTLWLVSPLTLIFTYKGQTGRYELGTDGLYWKPK